MSQSRAGWSCKLHQVSCSPIRALSSCFNFCLNTTNFGWRRDKYTHTRKKTQRVLRLLPPQPQLFVPLLKLSSGCLLGKVCDGLNYFRECFGLSGGFCSAVADEGAATPGCAQHGKSLNSTAASAPLFRCLERVCKGPDP